MRLLYAILCVLCVLVGLIVMRTEPVDGHGLAHPDHLAMQIGGSSQRHAGSIWIGWLYGALQISLYSGMLCLGLGKRSSGRLAVLSVGVLYLGVFSAVILSYVYGPEFFAGITPVSWMLFVLSPVPLLFVVLYSLMFPQWVFSQEDGAKFAALLKARRATAEVSDLEGGQ